MRSTPASPSTPSGDWGVASGVLKYTIHWSTSADLRFGSASARLCGGAQLLVLRRSLNRRFGRSGILPNRGGRRCRHTQPAEPFYPALMAPQRRLRDQHARALSAFRVTVPSSTSPSSASGVRTRGPHRGAARPKRQRDIVPDPENAHDVMVRALPWAFPRLSREVTMLAAIKPTRSGSG